MSSKAQQLEKLFESKLKQIGSSKGEWVTFLKTAARMYKYDFSDQVLIYAQRPNATACAPFEFWNNKASRWVNRGAKGIALFEKETDYPKLKYVFDLADTHAQRNRPEPYIWQMQSQHEAAIQEVLSTQMQVDFSGESMQETLFMTAILAVEEQVQTYLQGYLNAGKGSALEQVPDQEVGIVFRDAVVDSVAYLLMARCGLDADDYLKEQKFESVFLHDSLAAMAFLGTAVQEISKPLLRVIERTVRELDGQGLFDLRTVTQFDEISNAGYNQGITKPHSEQARQRSDKDEHFVQADGRLSDSRVDFGSTRAATGQIWENAQKVPDGASVVEVSVPTDAVSVGTTPAGNRTDRTREGSRADTGNVPEATGERDAEGERPNAVGERDDTDFARSTRNHIGGTDSQLNLFGQAEAQDVSAFSISEQEWKDILRSGSGFEGGQKRIHDFFSTAYSEKEGAEFLKQEYGIGGRTHILSDGRHGFLNYDSRGMYVEYGTSQAKISWNQAAKWHSEIVLENLFSQQAAQPLPSENYQITQEHLGAGGVKYKFQKNLEAILLVKQLQQEGRQASLQEQEILANYVGWGGLPQAFDAENEKWKTEYERLKAALSPAEYQAARASTLNAHYTSPIVIRAMYQALEQFGFEGGKILEPSCGVGNFFGMLPDAMQQSALYGVELDEITGQIAKQLYPKASIQIQGFEETSFADNSFDVVVGNVPFGSYRVNDADYQHLNFSIHNYFLAKSIDKVKEGGIVAVVTSRYTLDQQDTTVREYLAQRASLLGAIRLPKTAFRENAGTEVVADILFLQKGVNEKSAEWIDLQKNDEGFLINTYFVQHPEMILGTLHMESTQYGRQQYTCIPHENSTLDEELQQAVCRIKGTISPALAVVEQEQASSVLEPTGRNHSFLLQNGQVYYRDGQEMQLCALGKREIERIRAMIPVRDSVRELIEAQVQNCSDDILHALQQVLTMQYQTFVSQHGILNSRANRAAFSQDASYPLLCSLEILDEEGAFQKTSDIFTKRTIRESYIPDHAETSVEALAISIGEHAKVDLPWMSELLNGKPKEQIISDLRGLIFENPESNTWETADAYLSGNVREKLKVARQYAEQEPERWALQVESLERVQPADLTAAEIDVRLGATWISPEYIRQFLFEICQTPWVYRQHIRVLYAESSGVWNVTGKNTDSRESVHTTVTYGTKRINAYEIMQNTLNLKDVRIFDVKINPDGKEVRVLNTEETILAQQKQQAMQQAFKEWIFKEPSRRAALVTRYNEKFNSIRPRTYDGSHIRFVGMTPEINLRPHQRDAIARTLYGGNSLIAHVVGSGKTFTMIAAAMEAKRLELCHKSMFVVPNHLIQQWASDFLQLYPAANILVTTKKDFETSRRKKFCARIATGNYDAIIIGHSQFEKIPLSKERQVQTLEKQIDDITEGIEQVKRENGERFTIKQMEYTRKTLQARLERLSAQGKKDEVVTFEELGIDRLFVDEAHAYKNLFLFTKMRNVAGIGQTEAQKSSDLYAKCQYLDEKTNGRGVIFATGTPVSNSMTELYTMMRYLQGSTLREKGLAHFDSWASTFGETVTAMELAPEGTGYRARTRFSKFFNLPELMNMFKEVADIKTSDQLHLPVPEAKFEAVVVQPSEHQQAMVAELSERAAAVHSGVVDPSVDNMLKIVRC